MRHSEARMMLPGPGEVQGFLYEISNGEHDVDMETCDKLLDKITDFMTDENEDGSFRDEDEDDSS